MRNRVFILLKWHSSGGKSYKSTRRRENEDLIDFSRSYHPSLNDRYQRFRDHHFQDLSPGTPNYERQIQFQGNMTIYYTKLIFLYVTRFK